MRRMRSPSCTPASAPGPRGWREASALYLDALGKDERYQRLYAFSVDAWPARGGDATAPTATQADLFVGIATVIEWPKVPRFLAGDAVEVLWEADGQWYAAAVTNYTLRLDGRALLKVAGYDVTYTGTPPARR